MPAQADGCISIHVLRVEDDHGGTIQGGYTNISIHVLRVEDDTPLQKREAPTLYFNPRPPCGGRLVRSQLI